MAAVVRALAAGWLLANAAAAVHQRFQAMETSPALSPRFYKAAPARPLQRRQSQCTSGSHPCNEIGQVGSTACCSDTQYCIVDPDDQSKPACCPIGSTCGSPCNDQNFQCNVTATSTVGAETTTVVQATCCPRVCTSTSQFGCPTSLGGGCCSYGFVCGSSSQCLSTRTPSTSSTPLVTQIPTGCTTSQISCAESLGGGCCAATQSCTLITGRAHCADAIITPTASGVTKAEETGEIGAGAKAGIGVGVVCGSGLIIGAITWWCLRRRKVRRQSMSTHRPRPQGVIGTVLGGGRDTTEENSEMVSHSGPGMTQDYFGPDPVIGPYSEFHSPSGGTTPGVDRDRGGVPLIPHGPGDIAVPVEMDSSTPKLPEEPASYSGSRVSIPPPAPPPIPPPSHNMTEPVFELYGSDFLSVNPGNTSQGIPSPVTSLAPSPLDETPQSEAGNQPTSPRYQ